GPARAPDARRRAGTGPPLRLPAPARRPCPRQDSNLSTGSEPSEALSAETPVFAAVEHSTPWTLADTSTIELPSQSHGYSTTRGVARADGRRARSGRGRHRDGGPGGRQVTRCIPPVGGATRLGAGAH